MQLRYYGRQRQSHSILGYWQHGQVLLCIGSFLFKYHTIWVGIMESEPRSHDDRTFRSESTAVHYEKPSKPSLRKQESASSLASRSTSETAASTSNSQQTFGRSEGISHHVDTITDLLVSEVPYPLLISSSLDGCIKVWK